MTRKSIIDERKEKNDRRQEKMANYRKNISNRGQEENNGR
jgi:hypothetical protein